jgi:hypothetical protein
MGLLLYSYLDIPSSVFVNCDLIIINDMDIIT